MESQRRRKKGKEKWISIQLSHYGLKENGKTGRMMLVEDVRAIDNAASQTITSTGRGEPEQIGWNKWHAKGEAGPLVMAHPARNMGLDINPVPGSPFPTGGLSVWLVVSLGAGQARRHHTSSLEVCQDPHNFPDTGQLLEFQKKGQTF